MTQPRDAAQAVVFLASQMSNYVTGQTLNVDGGPHGLKDGTDNLTPAHTE